MVLKLCGGLGRGEEEEVDGRRGRLEKKGGCCKETARCLFLKEGTALGHK